MLSYLIPNVWNNSPQVCLLNLLNNVKEHKNIGSKSISSEAEKQRKSLFTY